MHLIQIVNFARTFTGSLILLGSCLMILAERLTWQFGEVPLPDKERNEELTWAVNYELGILDPAMEDPVQYLGGRKSQTDRFYPYQNEHEMKLALKYIFASEDITQVSWSLWIGMQMDLEKMFSVQAEPSTKPATPNPISGTRRPLDSNNRSRPKTPDIEEIDLTVSPDHASRKPTRRPTFGISTPPSCYSKNENKAQSLPCPKSTTPSTQAPSKSTPGPASAVQHTQPAPYFGKDRRIVSYKTLQDFYSLLDRIERTSYVGALFLEAYAERLQRVQCSNCYAQRYIDLDDPFVE
ncbi:hypothetical protein P280DRAFT_396460 [Massarina eburnea CBS 473.64]|uniref:Uncharacterized protein n=1 Tax=Massarina eburnea CBS 473.64 TaxID=1395130 RepID=A0A6A6S7P7_9PLEO|nr:hypothetical protein P280DRAFT_396460 [Massarina eburnea CBS 473.64]